MWNCSDTAAARRRHTGHLVPAGRAWAAALLLWLLLGLALPPAARAATVLPDDEPAAGAVAAAGDAFSVQEFDWFDSARGRPVPVRLYLPRPVAGALPTAWPLVVFSHGLGGSRRGYSYLGQHWASHGYASLHLQHVGSDRSLWAGNLLGLSGRLQAAAQEGEATARVADLRFALDQLLGGPLAARIDAGRIVAAGHSYGANTTLLAAGAQVQRNGQPVSLRDARIRAAIVISAPPFYGEASPAQVLASVGVPSLHITATEDTILVPGYHSSPADRVAVFEATGGPRKMLAVFAGGSHSIFTDRAGTGGVTLNPRIKQATQALSTAFLGSVFDGDSAPLRQWAEQFAGLLARVKLP